MNLTYTCNAIKGPLTITHVGMTKKECISFKSRYELMDFIVTHQVEGKASWITESDVLDFHLEHINTTTEPTIEDVKNYLERKRTK